MEKKIDDLKERLSDGNSRFEGGKVLAEVSLSDLNELFSLAYDLNNYRLNCLWNLEQTSKGCREQSDLTDKYIQSLELIRGISNGVDNPIVCDINRIANEALETNLS